MKQLLYGYIQELNSLHHYKDILLSRKKDHIQKIQFKIFIVFSINILHLFLQNFWTKCTLLFQYKSILYTLYKHVSLINTMMHGQFVATVMKWTYLTGVKIWQRHVCYDWTKRKTMKLMVGWIWNVSSDVNEFNDWLWQMKCIKWLTWL